MAENDSPKFEFVKDYEFTEGEKVYVIDENKYDIYEGLIKNIDGDGVFSIHYLEWPDDDCTLTEGDNCVFIAKAKKNDRIFRDQ